MAEGILQWAAREFCRRLGEDYTSFEAGRISSDVAKAIRLGAQLIAEHEEPPVDPLLIEARKLWADERPDFFHEGMQYKEGAGRDLILSGACDGRFPIQRYVAALRRGIELAERDRQP